MYSSSSDDQAIQKATLSLNKEQTSAKSRSIPDTNVIRSSNNEKIDKDMDKGFNQLITSTERSTEISIDPKLAKKIEVYNGLMRILPAYKQAMQLYDDLTGELQNLMNVEVANFLYDRNRFPEIHTISYSPNGIAVFDKQGNELDYNPEIKAFVDNANRRLEEIHEKMALIVQKKASLLEDIDNLCPREEFEGWTKETPPQRITGVVSRGHKGEPIDIDEYRLAKWLGKELPWDGSTSYDEARDFE